VQPKTILLVPETTDPAWRDAAGTPRALISGVAGNALRRQAVDRPRGIVARHFLQSRVHHRRDTGNGDGRFRDIGRDDNSAGVGGGGHQHAVLRAGIKRPV
jgi:hypothetical protein